jgi:hypothetical protein
MRTVRRNPRAAAPAATGIQMVDTYSLTPDKTNPRKPDPARLGLLRLSIAKLGFLMPVFAAKSTGLLLSGHQRQTVSKELELPQIPVMYVDIKDDDIAGVNILFNRTTNDFGAFDTGSDAKNKLDIEAVIAAAEELPDADPDNPFAINCKMETIAPILAANSDAFNDKAASQAQAILRMGIKIPAVVSKSGVIVNGVHRLFGAAGAGMTEWPIVRVPDQIASVATNFLNYLSMDFHVDDDFKALIRHSAYRRPQNNRGSLGKSYRFWANGERTLMDRDSYGPEFFAKFRDIHGQTMLDFGGGLCQSAPYLREKGFDAYDFEPFRIDPDSGVGVPSPDYSKRKASEFLQSIASPKLKFDSIFLSSVLNSVPFAEDRLVVLATTVYGTCRDISDFNYEYGGIRKANYFTFDTEPGVRVGDVMRNPKIQKFHTKEEAKEMFHRFWKEIDFWDGGNVFYWRLRAPMGFRPDVVSKALELEFDLPYADGTTMGLVAEAKKAFGRRLGVTLK